jgi:SAM-dependent methyltransferase
MGESVNLPRCILCNENTVEDWFVRTTGTRNYPIVRCRSCRSAYVWPRPTENVVEDIYADAAYSPDHARQGLYWPSGKSDAARLMSSFGPFVDGKVFFDIGAGVGVASEEAIRRGFTVRACEPSPQCRKEFSERNGFEPEPSFFDQRFAMENRDQVDSALLSHVLEHVPNPEQVLQDVRCVLRPRGVVMIAVPLFGSVITAVLGKRDFFITPPEHLTYFPYAGLAALLKRNGFVVESMFTSPKVNMLRYRNRLGLACYAVNLAAYSVLKLSEVINRSIVLNVCARRT